MLPALLQGFDSINVQYRLCAQHQSFFNHDPAAGNAVGAGGGQHGVGQVHGGFPLRLDFSKDFFAQVAGVGPLVDKAVQAANLHLPVGAGLVGIGPGQHFINQHLAFGFDGFGLRVDRLKPGLNHFVSLVAGIVKALPQRLVGRAALVAGFPLVPHHTQRILLLAATHGLDQQGLGLDDQFFTNLIRTPALPAFKLTSIGQGCMRSSFELAVNVANVFFQRLAQICCHLGCGFAVAFGHFVHQARHGFLHDGRSPFAQVFQNRRVHLGLGRTTGAVTADNRYAFAAQFAQFVSPHGHGGQRG